MVVLHEEHEELVQAMIEYFYTTRYLDSDLDKSIVMRQRKRCDHAADIKCSFNLKDCCLKPFGIAIALHTLGDKYDIPGLRKHSCTYLHELFRRITLWAWRLYVAIWQTRGTLTASVS